MIFPALLTIKMPSAVASREAWSNDKEDFNTSSTCWRAAFSWRARASAFCEFSTNSTRARTISKSPTPVAIQLKTELNTKTSEIITSPHSCKNVNSHRGQEGCNRQPIHHARVQEETSHQNNQLLRGRTSPGAAKSTWQGYTGKSPKISSWWPVDNFLLMRIWRPMTSTTNMTMARDPIASFLNRKYWNEDEYDN